MSTSKLTKLNRFIVGVLLNFHSVNCQFLQSYFSELPKKIKTLRRFSALPELTFPSIINSIYYERPRIKLYISFNCTSVRRGCWK